MPEMTEAVGTILHAAGDRPGKVRQMISVSVLSVALALLTSWASDRILIEHTTTASEVRIEGVERIQAEHSERLRGAATRDDLRGLATKSDIEGLEKRMDDLREVLLELQRRQR